VLLTNIYSKLPSTVLGLHEILLERQDVKESVVLIYYMRPTATTQWQQAYKEDNGEEISAGVRQKRC
jgi:hypothetical protein